MVDHMKLVNGLARQNWTLEQFSEAVGDREPFMRGFTLFCWNGTPLELIPISNGAL